MPTETIYNYNKTQCVKHQLFQFRHMHSLTAQIFTAFEFVLNNGGYSPQFLMHNVLPRQQSASNYPFELLKTNTIVIVTALMICIHRNTHSQFVRNDLLIEKIVFGYRRGRHHYALIFLNLLCVVMANTKKMFSLWYLSRCLSPTFGNNRLPHRTDVFVNKEYFDS